MKDLEPILNVLCNYQAHLILSTEEVGILSEWLKDSKKHEQLFDDLNNNMKWVLGEYEGNQREIIQARLIEMEGPEPD